MPIYKMKLCPQQSGYSVAHGFNRVIQDTGYMPRSRVAVKRQGHQVPVTWLTDKNGYDYLVAFFNLQQNSNEEYFLLDLIVDSADLQEYRCMFRSGIQLTQVSGKAFWVSAELYVRAKKRSDEQDEIIELGVLDLINPLEKLVNEDLPNALEGL